VTKLSTAIDWQGLTGAYWGGLAARALLCSVVLYVVGFPLEQTLKPAWQRYRHEPARFLGAAIFAAVMYRVFGGLLGTMIIVDGLALAEWLERANGSIERINRQFRALLLPAIYLFLGLILVFTYNDLIACARRLDAYDWLYLKLDSLLVPDTSVSQLSKAVLSEAPGWLLSAIEFVYYGMFGQVGAGLILVSLCIGKREGLRYVGTILTAYYLALAIFYVWPSMGPFYTCVDHFTAFPHELSTYGIQQTAIAKAKLLAATSYRPYNRVETDYFIAFPCMHIAQPLVVLWFLRRYRRMMVLLLAHDILLLPAILLLEWHYYVDLVAGIGVAAFAIWLSQIGIGASASKPRRQRTQTQPLDLDL
jgi:hypothetical protein